MSPYIMRYNWRYISVTWSIVWVALFLAVSINVALTTWSVLWRGDDYFIQSNRGYSISCTYLWTTTASLLLTCPNFHLIQQNKTTLAQKCGLKLYREVFLKDSCIFNTLQNFSSPTFIQKWWTWSTILQL